MMQCISHSGHYFCYYQTSNDIDNILIIFKPAKCKQIKSPTIALTLAIAHFQPILDTKLSALPTFMHEQYGFILSLRAEEAIIQPIS